MLTQLNMPRLETIRQTAKLTGLAVYHVRKLVLQGKVKYVRSGLKYLVNVDSLVEYLNNGEAQAEAEELTENTSKIRKVGI